jgi:hypothetical protein
LTFCKEIMIKLTIYIDRIDADQACVKLDGAYRELTENLKNACSNEQ